MASTMGVASLTVGGAFRKINLQSDDIVVISAASGGIGSIAVQYAVAKGAKVLGIASENSSEYIKSLGGIPISYNRDIESQIYECLSEKEKVTKFLDTDKKIPGTLNVAHTVPVLMEAFLFLTGVKVEGVTLFSMIAAAIVGALIGARIVNKLPEKKIQLVMGVCLIVTAFLMASGQLGWLKALGSGNEAVGLTGIKLIIGIVGNFILGALMMAGVGLYAPCMAMVYMLGLSPLVAFPIMMGSCAGLMAIGSPEFIRAGNYTRIGSIAITIGGVIGVTVAYTLVKSMPLEVLTWVIIAVVIVTGISMIRQGTKKEA